MGILGKHTVSVRFALEKFLAECMPGVSDLDGFSNFIKTGRGKLTERNPKHAYSEVSINELSEVCSNVSVPRVNA